MPSSADSTNVTPRLKVAQACKLRHKNVATYALDFDGASQYFIAQVNKLPSTVFCVGYSLRYTWGSDDDSVFFEIVVFHSFFKRKQQKHINQSWFYQVSFALNKPHVF